MLYLDRKFDINKLIRLCESVKIVNDKESTIVLSQNQYDMHKDELALTPYKVRVLDKKVVNDIIGVVSEDEI